MGKFALDLEQFEKSTLAKANLVVRKIVFDVDASLVYKSPVGNPDLWKHKNKDGSYRRLFDSEIPDGYVGGRFRANWQYGSGLPNGKTTTTVDADGGASVERFMNEVDENALGKKHYITNSLPYAKRLEDGWSMQAPAGMVMLTTIEFIPIVNAAAVAVKETGTKGFGL